MEQLHPGACPSKYEDIILESDVCFLKRKQRFLRASLLQPPLQANYVVWVLITLDFMNSGLEEEIPWETQGKNAAHQENEHNTQIEL